MAAVVRHSKVMGPQAAGGRLQQSVSRNTHSASFTNSSPAELMRVALTDKQARCVPGGCWWAGKHKVAKTGCETSEASGSIRGTALHNLATSSGRGPHPAGLQSGANWHTKRHWGVYVLVLLVHPARSEVGIQVPADNYHHSRTYIACLTKGTATPHSTSAKTWVQLPRLASRYA
jgi:hypothetical protein